MTPRGNNRTSIDNQYNKDNTRLDTKKYKTQRQVQKPGHQRILRAKIFKDKRADKERLDTYLS